MNIIRFHREIKQEFINFGYELVAGGLWKGDILIADLEDLEKLDASDIYPRRINAREVSIIQTDDEFILPVADGTAKLLGRDHEQPVRSEDLRGELHGELGESPPTESTDDAEARNDFWSIEGDFIYRHHTEPRIHLYVPKEASFPIPLKQIDVT